MYNRPRQAQKSKDKGKAKKPPLRHNKNQWYFNSNTDCCQKVWQMGQDYMLKFQHKATTPRRHMKYPALLTKYMYFLYLTGSRSMEPILSKNMLLEVRSEKGVNYIYVKRINEKHKDSNGNPQQIEVVIPIFCEYERLMWKYITSSGDDLNTKSIFRFDMWSKLYHVKLAQYINNYTIDLRDGEGTLHKKTKLTPHILRHMRAFNMLVNHRAPDVFVLDVMGWNNSQMLYYYAYIKNMMRMESMLKLAKDSGLLNQKFNLEHPMLAVPM